MFSFVTQGNGVTIVVEKPKFDASQVAAFKAGVKGFDFSGVSHVDIDLSGVTFMDSSGVGALLTLYKAMPHQNVPIRIRGAARNVRDVMELLRLHRIFEILNEA